MRIYLVQVSGEVTRFEKYLVGSGNFMLDKLFQGRMYMSLDSMFYKEKI